MLSMNSGTRNGNKIVSQKVKRLETPHNEGFWNRAWFKIAWTFQQEDWNVKLCWMRDKCVRLRGCYAVHGMFEISCGLWPWRPIHVRSPHVPPYIPQNSNIYYEYFCVQYPALQGKYLTRTYKRAGVTMLSPKFAQSIHLSPWQICQ